MQLVPVPLQYGDNDMESRHSLKQQHERHPLLYPICKELQEHNACTANLQGSLAALQDMLKGKRTFVCAMAHLLTDILQNMVPSLWDCLANTVPPCKEHKNELRLLPLLQLHQSRVLFYNDSLQRGCPSPTINVLWFSKPHALMSVLCQCFADKHRIPLDEVHLQTEVCALNLNLTTHILLFLLCSCLQHSLKNMVVTTWPFMV